MTFEAIAEQIQSGQHEAARQAIDAIEPSDENRADILFLQGYLKETTLDREAAIETYDDVLDADPDHRQAIFRKALLADAYGDDETAIACYEQCIEEPPVPINALINLAVLYEDAGRFNEAKCCLDSVLKEHPNHWHARQLHQSVVSSFNMVYDEHSQREREKRNAVLDTPVTDFELSVRSRNCLRQMQIRTLGDLLQTTEAELLSYKNFGETSLKEIKAMLAQKGLQLGQALAPAAEPIMPETAAPPAAGDALLGRPVSELELSIRSRKCLQRLAITTLGELVARSEGELMSNKNFGMTSLAEIKSQLSQLGLSLRQA